MFPCHGNRHATPRLLSDLISLVFPPILLGAFVLVVGQQFDNFICTGIISNGDIAFKIGDVFMVMITAFTFCLSTFSDYGYLIIHG